MINYRELRIGNIVRYKGELVKVNSVGRVYMTHKPLSGGYVSHKLKYEEYEPVDLTEKLILELGFEKITYQYGHTDFGLFEDFYYKKDLKEKSFMVLEDDFSLGIYSDDYHTSMALVPKESGWVKLHELQNIYYDLVEKELKLNI